MGSGWCLSQSSRCSRPCSWSTGGGGGCDDVPSSCMCFPENYEPAKPGERHYGRRVALDGRTAIGSSMNETLRLTARAGITPVACGRSSTVLAGESH
jgi:hypothetical protein